MPQPHLSPYNLRLRHRETPCSNSVHSKQTPPSRRRKRDNGDDSLATYTGTKRTTTTATDPFKDDSTPSRQQKRDHGTGLLLYYGSRNPSGHHRRSDQRRRRSSSTGIMSGAGGKWKEEQILVICPGSRTTMAQLGCSELTPPTHRIPTRMFRDGDEWRPYYTFRRTKVVGGIEQEEWVEDVDEDKGAVYPLQGMLLLQLMSPIDGNLCVLTNLLLGGRIVHLDAFLAFLDHVHSLLTTTYHNTPIMLMASPQWTRPDCEAIAQYIFEKTRTPALCLIHSAIATQYGLKFPHMTIVDIGFEKVDVTAIHDGRVVNHMDLGAPREAGAGGDGHISGGEVFTRRLMRLLEGKRFTHGMAEQLKRSAICEVLPYVGTEPALFELPKEEGGAPAGGEVSADGSQAPKLSGANRGNGENGEGNEDEDGVLDVASIVTSGQTKEFLAKKEKEKTTKAGRKGKDKDAEAQPKPGRLPNNKRTRNSFAFEEVVIEEVPIEPPVTNAPATNGSAQAPAPVDGSTATGAEPPKPAGETADAAAASEAKPDTTATEKTKVATEQRPKRVRRDIEVGVERFTFADREEIDRIVSAIYRTLQGIEDMYMRPPCWENLVFVGNGSRLRGLKENILQTLNARHLVSPSTATMFTSELPSNMATPTGTGAQTPTGSFTGAPHQLSSSGVNPLLQAATTASTLGVAGGAAPGMANSVTLATPQAGSEAGGPVATPHFHSQTPTSIKTVNLPTYLQEWTKNGFEESMFLGAQVAARIVFCLHSNVDAQGVEAQRMASLNRVDYK